MNTNQIKIDDIKAYLNTCKKWLINQIEQENANAGDAGFGCHIYCQITELISRPFLIESLGPWWVEGRYLQIDKGIFGGVSYVPSANSIRKKYSDMDIGTLKTILDDCRPNSYFYI